MTPRTIAEKFAASVAVVESGDSRGTAFVIGSAGYALTCEHVLEKGKPVRLVFLDPKNPTEDSITVGADILDHDEEKDVALLKFDPPHELTPVRFSRDERCSLGEPTVVIGNPGLGESVLERTVTTGVVSSTGRRIGTYPLIQLSAQVNPGSSGGPVFDELGRVIGMVTLKARIEGAGFAAPAPELTRFLLRSASFDDESIQLEREWGEKESERAVTARLLSCDDEAARVQAQSGRTYVLPKARLNEGDSLFLSELAKIRRDRAAESDP
jgi:S1-C subfamily serine protease